MIQELLQETKVVSLTYLPMKYHQTISNVLELLCAQDFITREDNMPS